jgi:DNA polymerase-4
MVVTAHTFEEDAHAVPLVEGALYGLVEKAGQALRQQSLAAGRVIVTVDFSDGLRCARQRSLRPATAKDMALFEMARFVLHMAWRRRVRIRHLRLMCDRLTFPPAQQELFPAAADADHRQTSLVSALDRIRQRFGADAIKVGRTLAPTAS